MESVERITVEEIVPRKRKPLPSTEERHDPVVQGPWPEAHEADPSNPGPLPANTLERDAITVAFQALAYALSARAMLLLALIGGFILATMAMWSQKVEGLEVFALYSILIVLPIVVLEIRKRGA